MVIYLLVGVAVFLPFIPILKTVGSLFSFDTGETGVTSPTNLLFLSALNISFLVGAWITLKWIDRRPPALLGLSFSLTSLRELSIGFGIGLANFGAVFLFLLLFGWVSIEQANISTVNVGTFSWFFATFFVFAAFEELINRGYLFQAFCEGAGVWTAAIVTNAVFSLVHIANPAFSVLGGIFLFVHGLLYTVVYLQTRSLWSPIGLHAAWNFAQGPIAGMNISGTSVGSSLLVTSANGPQVVTGGDFGIEGSIISILISAIILLIVLKTKWLKPSARFLLIEKQWANNRSDRENSASGG